MALLNRQQKDSSALMDTAPRNNSKLLRVYFQADFLMPSIRYLLIFYQVPTEHHFSVSFSTKARARHLQVTTTLHFQAQAAQLC